MKPLSQNPALDEFVSLTLALRKIDSDVPQLVLISGGSELDLLGKTLSSLTLLTDEDVHFAPTFYACGVHKCQVCYSDVRYATAAKELSQSFGALTGQKPSVLVLPFAESILDGTLSERIGPAVTEILSHIDRLKRQSVPHKLVLLTSTPWALDPRLLDSRRLDEAILIQDTIWVEEASDKTLSAKVTKAVISFAVDRFIALLGQTDGSGPVSVLKGLIEKKAPEGYLLTALASNFSLLNSGEKSRLRKLLSNEQLKKLDELLSLREKNIRKIPPVQKISSTEVVRKIAANFPLEETQWLNQYLKVTSALPGEKYGETKILEGLTVKLSLGLHPESHDGKVFKTFLTNFLHRHRMVGDDEEAFYLRFLDDPNWRSILLHLPPLLNVSNSIVEKLLELQGDITAITLLAQCFSHRNVSILGVSDDDHAMYDRKYIWPKLVELALIPGKSQQNARAMLLEIIPFSKEVFLSLLIRTLKKKAEVSHAFESFSRHSNLYDGGMDHAGLISGARKILNSLTDEKLHIYAEENFPGDYK